MKDLAKFPPNFILYTKKKKRPCAEVYQTLFKFTILLYFSAGNENITTKKSNFQLHSLSKISLFNRLEYSIIRAETIRRKTASYKIFSSTNKLMIRRLFLKAHQRDTSKKYYVQPEHTFKRYKWRHIEYEKS